MTSFLKTMARIAAPRRNDHFELNQNSDVHRRTGDPRLDLALAERR